MRKKAQENKRALCASSTSSNCSSSSSNTEPSDSKGTTQTRTTGSFHGPEIEDTYAVQGKKSEQEEDIYSMDEIWKDITSSEEPITPMCEVTSNFSCPPIASPMWEYCPDTLWKMDDREYKMIFPTNDPFPPTYAP